MADKYSHKPSKKKKSPARKPGAIQETMQYTPVAPTAATAAAPATIPAPTVRPERAAVVAPNLTVELKRVGILGGIMLVVLVAASLLFG